MNLLPGAGKGETPLGVLVARLRGLKVPAGDEEAPAAILWTDPERAWAPVVPRLRERAPELLVLGGYDKEARTGPAIWMRWRLGLGKSRYGDAGSEIPILYLPGVARNVLREGKGCPEALRPLVELLYRGKPWLQKNGKDWTPTAFLGSADALGLDLVGDAASIEALAGGLPEVMERPVERLRGWRLDAAFFRRLRVSDPDRELLAWMGDPDGVRTRLGGDWEALRGLCRDGLGFDPGAETPLEAGPRLAAAAGDWARVWRRYAEAPENYPGVEDVLRSAQPEGRLFMGMEARWPRENDRLEEELGAALGRLPGISQPKAYEKILELEAEHGKRGAWAWARLGRSPLAAALAPLARLAAGTGSPIGGSDPEAFRSAWRERVFPVDAATWEAVAAAGPTHEKLVGRAVRHLLEPWLDASARAFQQAVARSPLPVSGEQPPVEAPEGGCLFFVDALRCDVGEHLAERLRETGFRVEVQTRWTALPTVTATAKPAVTPLAKDFDGPALDATFAPRHREKGRPLHAAGARERMRMMGYQIVSDTERPEARRGWAESGALDRAGHTEQDGFPRRILSELDRLAERIRKLLAAGWGSVRVVTDHGWLFLPGGLPKVDLPKHLTATRWARAAVLAGDGDPGVPRFPWTWNSGEWFATPPGIACFNKSDAFAHGGVSLQECLTPDILVEKDAAGAGGAKIESVTWEQLRCRVAVSGGRGLSADLRLGGAAGVSVAHQAKPVENDGAVSLLLADEDHKGQNLLVVVLDEAGQPVAMWATRGGQNP